MERYRNLAGDSGVVAYARHADSIAVKFYNGDVYLYTYESAGKENVERMKALARSGRGLSTFISQCVREAYAEKLA